MEEGHNKSQPSKDERIRTRAYLIWEKDGRPDGHAWAHWFKASELVDQEDQEPSSMPNGPVEGQESPI
jgi:hypothetical protein